MIARFRPTSAPIKLAAGLAFAFLASFALIQPGFTFPSGVSAASPRGMPLENDAKTATPLPVSQGARAGGVPMKVFIEQVAANIHKRLIVDPKVASTVTLYGQRLDQITYPDFLTILRINGYTAIEVNDYVNVVPLAEVRTWPLPTFTENRVLPDDQFANMSVDLKNSCAPYLIPILRPLLPPYAHLAADMSSNTIIAVDTYANLKRVRSIITQLDARTKPGTRCGAGPK